MTGTDPNVNVTVCGVGRSRTKSLTLICIYGECNAILPFVSGKKTRLLFCFRDTFARMSRQMACFSIKLEQQRGLVFFFQNALLQNIRCESHACRVGSITSRCSRRTHVRVETCKSKMDNAKWKMNRCSQTWQIHSWGRLIFSRLSRVSWNPFLSQGTELNRL